MMNSEVMRTMHGNLEKRSLTKLKDTDIADKYPYMLSKYPIRTKTPSLEFWFWRPNLDTVVFSLTNINCNQWVGWKWWYISFRHGSPGRPNYHRPNNYIHNTSVDLPTRR